MSAKCHTYYLAVSHLLHTFAAKIQKWQRYEEDFFDSSCLADDDKLHHQLSKQEICDALWPKKPDASETLYTLIRRIKPVIELNSNLMIESERGKSYRLIIR